MDARVTVKPKPMDEERFQSIVRQECMQAVDWIDSNLSETRQLAEGYYQGKTLLKTEPGRSGIIITVVRDTIHAVLPNIARIFTQTDQIGEFESDDEEDEQICKEQTIFVNGVFNKYGGYTALIHATTNALKARVGVVRVKLIRNKIGSYKKAVNLTPDEMATIQLQCELEDSTITETSAPDENGMQSVVIMKPSYRNRWELSCIAPEQLFIDADATSIENARIVGIRQDLPIWEAMRTFGLEREELLPMTSDDSTTLRTEKLNRLGYDPASFDDDWSNDETAKRVLITEAWIRVDADGDDVIELRHVVCGGPNYEILIEEVVSFVPLAPFLVDLQPNVFFPISLAEDLMQDQDAQTSVIRSILDNVAFVNAPRTGVNEVMVNLEDAKNPEIGAMIRTKGPPADHIVEFSTPFVAGQTLPVLQELKNSSEQRSGVTKLSQGLDPDALQSTSRIAANAAVMGGDARLEMMARNIGETGVKSLFITILKTAMYELRGPTSIKTPGGYKNINPALWHDSVTVTPNVGLGSGRIDEKKQTLQGIAGAQQEIIKMLGVENPLTGWNNLRNSFRDILRLSGIRNVQDFFPFNKPEDIKAFSDKMKQEQAQAAQAQQPPAPDLVGAAKVKGEVDMQINNAKISAQANADMQKMHAAALTEFSKMQKEQQKMFAELTQKHQLAMIELKAELIKELTIAAWNVDQKRDAANQQYAVDSTKVGVDAATKVQVARENAENNVEASA